MTIPVSALTPVPGALEVSINPIFSWPAITGATYEFVIGEDPTFAIIDYSANTGKINAHTLPEPLRYYTTYFWRVRVVSATAQSAWTTGVFITKPKPLPSTLPAGTALPVQVFVSHTQKDVEFCDIFDRAIARVGVKAFRSEFEKIGLPAWHTIRDAIRSSCALFLLVGKELVKAQASGEPSWSHTQNWIAYETGVACERGIDVWVICDDTKINFPVPYLNNYLAVSLRHKQSFDYFVSILQSYATGLKTTFPNDKSVTQCPYADCKAIYNLNVRLRSGGEIVCPQCLQTILFPKGWPAT